MSKQTKFDQDLPKIFGTEYAEIVRSNSLEYMVEHGISSGLKSYFEKTRKFSGFNTEDALSKSLGANLSIADPNIAGMHLQQANLIATLQCRELLAIIAENSDKTVGLLEKILSYAKQ